MSDRVQHETSLEGPILEDVEETIAREEVDLGISPPNTELDEGEFEDLDIEHGTERGYLSKKYRISRIYRKLLKPGKARRLKRIGPELLSPILAHISEPYYVTTYSKPNDYPMVKWSTSGCKDITCAGSGAPNTELPATMQFAPAAAAVSIVDGPKPPSTCNAI
ncbi:hypothetical protein Tco_0644199 [Tanacetum coccineum]